MIQRDIKVFGGTKEAASGSTPDNIDPIGKPGIHLIAGATGSGKSNVARNITEAYGEAHARAKTNPPPDVLIFTGAGGDPVWEDVSGSRVKKYTPQKEQEFVDEVNRRYDRAMRAKPDDGAMVKPLGADGKGIFKPKVAGGGITGSGGPPQAGSKLAAAASASGSGAPPDAHRPAIIVIDDAAASDILPTQMGRSPIAQAIQSHRHADMSFVISSQRYHNHNPFLRANASSVSVFPPKGAEEMNFLKRDLPIPHEAMKRGFAVAAANSSHDFIHVDMKDRVATHNFSGRAI